MGGGVHIIYITNLISLWVYIVGLVHAHSSFCLSLILFVCLTLCLSLCLSLLSLSPSFFLSLSLSLALSLSLSLFVSIYLCLCLSLSLSLSLSLTLSLSHVLLSGTFPNPLNLLESVNTCLVTESTPAWATYIVCACMGGWLLSQRKGGAITPKSSTLLSAQDTFVSNQLNHC